MMTLIERTKRSMVVEELAREQEHLLRDRYAIGYAAGLKSAVLTLRQRGCLANSIGEAKRLQSVRGGKDEYDLGFVEGLEKARQVSGDPYMGGILNLIRGES